MDAASPLFKEAIISFAEMRRLILIPASSRVPGRKSSSSTEKLRELPNAGTCAGASGAPSVPGSVPPASVDFENGASA